MNLRDWLQRYGGRTPTTQVIDYEGKFKAVLCGACDEIMSSPFSDREWWEPWEIVIRRFQVCEHCGVHNKVAPGVTRKLG